MPNKIYNKLTLFIFLAIAPYAYAKPAKTSKNSKKEKTSISAEYMKQALQEAAEQVGVPASLLQAICSVESRLQADAFVYNDGGDHNHAFGMCQVLLPTAEAMIGKDPKCHQDFRDKEKSYKTCKFFGPKMNALAAARYLKMQIDRYKGDLDKATAAYNSGSVLRCGKDGFVKTKYGKKIHTCIPGDLLNRYYLDRVKVALAKLEPVQTSPASSVKNHKGPVFLSDNE